MNPDPKKQLAELVNALNTLINLPPTQTGKEYEQSSKETTKPPAGETSSTNLPKRPQTGS